MSNHTPEPWSKNAISPTVYDGNGIAILRCEGRTLIAENEANASRIVACVNACKGLPNEVLLKMASGEMDGSEIVELYKAQAQLATITAQRDELKDQSEYVLRECKEPEALNDESLNICNIATGIRDLRAELEEVAAQRDELLAAVKSAKSWLEGWASADQEIEILDMAIAKCEVQNG